MKPTDKIKYLNGEWNFITDINGKLTYNDVSPLILKRKKEKINIPVNWEPAGLHNYSGVVWFAKSFSLKEKSKLTILEFKGVDYFADVWLNDIHLGNHEGYFQSFYFDVSDFVKEKENLLVVKVNSPREEPGKIWPLKKKLIKGIFNHHDCRPGGWSYEHGQDKNTGGIWNNVLLHLADEVYLESVNVSSQIDFENEKASIKVSLNYYKKSNSILKDKIKVVLVSPSGKKIKFIHEVTLNESRGKADFLLDLKNPELWWSRDLGNPNLYELKISGKYINIEEVKFGIREVELNEKSEFFLNRKKLFLRGTNVIPTQFLSELNAERIREQVTLIREANIKYFKNACSCKQ